MDNLQKLHIFVPTAYPEKAVIDSLCANNPINLSVVERTILLKNYS